MDRIRFPTPIRVFPSSSFEGTRKPLARPLFRTKPFPSLLSRQRRTKRDTSFFFGFELFCLFFFLHPPILPVDLLPPPFFFSPLYPTIAHRPTRSFAPPPHSAPTRTRQGRTSGGGGSISAGELSVLPTTHPSRRARAPLRHRSTSRFARVGLATDLHTPFFFASAASPFFRFCIFLSCPPLRLVLSIQHGREGRTFLYPSLLPCKKLPV